MELHELGEFMRNLYEIYGFTSKKEGDWISLQQ